MRVQNPTLTALPPRDPAPSNPTTQGPATPFAHVRTLGLVFTSSCPSPLPFGSLQCHFNLQSGPHVHGPLHVHQCHTSATLSSPPRTPNTVSSRISSIRCYPFNPFSTHPPERSVVSCFCLKCRMSSPRHCCLVVTHLRCIQQAPGAEDALSKCLCMNKHVTGHDLAQRIFVFKEVGEGMKAICEKPAANVLGNGERLRASSPRSGTGQGCSLLPGLFVYPEGILQVLARALGKGKRLKAF